MKNHNLFHAYAWTTPRTILWNVILEIINWNKEKKNLNIQLLLKRLWCVLAFLALKQNIDLELQLYKI